MYLKHSFLERIKEKKNKYQAKAWMSLAHNNHDRTVHEYTHFMVDPAREHGYHWVMIGRFVDDLEENWHWDPLTEGPLCRPPIKTWL